MTRYYTSDEISAAIEAMEDPDYAPREDQEMLGSIVHDFTRVQDRADQATRLLKAFMTVVQQSIPGMGMWVVKAQLQGAAMSAGIQGGPLMDELLAHEGAKVDGVDDGAKKV